HRARAARGGRQSGPDSGLGRPYAARAVRAASPGRRGDCSTASVVAGAGRTAIRFVDAPVRDGSILCRSAVYPTTRALDVGVVGSYGVCRLDDHALHWPGRGVASRYGSRRTTRDRAGLGAWHGEHDRRIAALASAAAHAAATAHADG